MLCYVIQNAIVGKQVKILIVPQSPCLEKNQVSCWKSLLVVFLVEGGGGGGGGDGVKVYHVHTPFTPGASTIRPFQGPDSNETYPAVAQAQNGMSRTGSWFFHAV